jgi:ubiquinone/menaquinone biosynthesis C-methylase UbiE
MKALTHFDRRVPSYAADEIHQRIVAILVSGAQLHPGTRALDIATATGAVALKAAEDVDYRLTPR